MLSSITEQVLKPFAFFQEMTAYSFIDIWLFGQFPASFYNYFLTISYLRRDRDLTLNLLFCTYSSVYNRSNLKFIFHVYFRPLSRIFNRSAFLYRRSCRVPILTAKSFFLLSHWRSVQGLTFNI